MKNEKIPLQIFERDADLDEIGDEKHDINFHWPYISILYSS
jgi:hypothetical protein